MVLPAASVPFQVTLINPGSPVTLPAGRDGSPGTDSPGVLIIFVEDHTENAPPSLFHLNCKGYVLFTSRSVIVTIK